MDTNRHTARRAAAVLLTGVGLGVAWGPAQVGLARPGDRPPAARLLPPQPLDPADVAARAAPVDYLRPAAPTRDPNPAAPKGSTIPDGWTAPPPATPPPPQPAGTAPPGPGVWDGLKGAVAGGTKAVKSALGVKPDEPPPRPRVGQAAPPRSPLPAVPTQTPNPPAVATRPPGWEAPPRPAEQPLQGMSPTGAPVYAGAPAYRWYGWGTTTPGQNPLAPGGEYPQGSANWYAQSGATPGAFPVPVANPFRPPPGSGPPAYLVAELPARPVGVTAPPAPRPIAQSVPAGPPTAPAPPPTAWRPPAGMTTTTPAPVPSPAEPRWQPAPVFAPPPVVRGQQPEDDVELARHVRAACAGLVTDVAVERVGPNRLAVSFAATTEAIAGIAARAVSATPELRPVAIDFRVKLTGR